MFSGDVLEQIHPHHQYVTGERALVATARDIDALFKKQLDESLKKLAIPST